MLYKVFDQETSALRSICYARLAYDCTRQCEIVSPRMPEDDHTVLLILFDITTCISFNGNTK